jgi:ferric-dicitrate binding protein FerR (iron transport regulator)
MSTNAPSMDSSTPLNSPLGDLSALERLFRARYTAVSDQVRQDLADAAASTPKVVESAFRTVWDERARLQTPEQVDAFLADAIKHGAARERSRRAAAHRLEAGKGHAPKHASATATMDVDQSWAHLSQSILAPAGTAPGGGAGHAKTHVTGLAKKKKNWVVPVLIILAAGGIVGYGIFYLQRLGDAGAVTNALAAADATTHATGATQQGDVTLNGDSTQIHLAPETKLVVPKKFSKSFRAVKLDGAATFAIKQGFEKPFEIRAGKASIVATGTKLAVRSYTNDSTVTVQVTEGSVNVKVGEEIRPVAAGSSVILDKTGKLRDPDPQELAEAVSWIKDTVTINNRQLRTAIQQLKRWYGLDIKVADLTLLERPVSIHATTESPKAAISEVEKSAGLKFEWEGQQMVFKDARAKEAAPNAKGAAAKKK